MPHPPEAPSAPLQVAPGQRPSPSAGTNGMPFVSGLSPLKGAPPADRRSRIRGVHVLHRCTAPFLFHVGD